MGNRIRTLHVREGRLDPAEAEIWLTIEPESLTSTTQVRGRMMGPRCRYANTVEVAYHLREYSREYESTGIPRIVMRVVIPEANLWDPESPFLYQGPVELWQESQLCDTWQVERGLRTLHLGPSGLRVNGRRLTIRGLTCERLSQEDALWLRQAGYNTLLVSVRSECAGLYQLADEFGFLVLGHIQSRQQLKWAAELVKHASFLGWIVDLKYLDDPVFASERSLAVTVLPTYVAAEQPLVGVALTELPQPGLLPETLSFVACQRNFALDPMVARWPKIILGNQSDNAQGTEPDRVSSPPFLGRVDTIP